MSAATTRRVDAEEQPLAVDHRDDGSAIADDQPLEVCVELVATCLDHAAYRGSAPVEPVQVLPASLLRWRSRVEVSAGLKISATSTERVIAAMIVIENCW